MTNQAVPPRTPFSTHLSRSARETELRLRSIFQWKKKRPPVLLMVLAALACLSCGSLVSCQVEGASPDAASVGSGESTVWDALRAGADLTGLDDSEGLACTALASVSGDGYTLAALTVHDWQSNYVLVIGAADDGAGELLGPVFQTGASGGVPFCTALEDYHGAPALLYTANGMSQGLSWGEAGLVSWSEKGLDWSWPAEGDVLAEGSQARADYDAYWTDHLALMAPGGVDVFARTDNAVIDGDGPQWAPDHNELFYAAPEDQLPIGVYYQVRTWLEEFTRNQINPWNSQNASAVWQISSLIPEDGVYPDRNFDGEARYHLVARAENGEDQYFSANLIFDHGEGRVTGVDGWATGTAVFLGLANAAYSLSLADGRELTVEFRESLTRPGEDETYRTVDEILVWDGEELLQTITAGAVTGSGDYLFEGLYRIEGSGDTGAPDLRDINFDGSDDLGVLAAGSLPRNVPYAYFVWDEGEEQLVFSQVLFGPVTLDYPDREVIEFSAVQNGLYLYDHYVPDSSGALRLTLREEEDQLSQTAPWGQVWVNTYEPEGDKLVRTGRELRESDWSQYLTMPRELSPPPEAEPPAVTPDPEARAAFAAALEALISDYVLPGGVPVDPPATQDGMAANQFAVCDVDGDGEEELVIGYVSGMYAGYRGMVYRYDPASGRLETQLEEFPMLTFYDNGAVQAGWSHNQGRGGRFWPYTLYRYQPETDRYDRVGSADAYDLEVAAYNDLHDYPFQTDTSRSGFVFYLDTGDGGSAYDVPLDLSDYLAWRESWLGGASRLNILYQSLTRENIEALVG